MNFLEAVKSALETNSHVIGPEGSGITHAGGKCCNFFSDADATHTLLDISTWNSEIAGLPVEALFSNDWEVFGVESGYYVEGLRFGMKLLDVESLSPTSKQIMDHFNQVPSCPISTVIFTSELMTLPEALEIHALKVAKENDDYEYHVLNAFDRSEPNGTTKWFEPNAQTAKSLQRLIDG